MKTLEYDEQFFKERIALIEEYSAEQNPDICCCGGYVSTCNPWECGTTGRSEVEYIATLVAEENLRKRMQHPCSGKCTEYRNEQCKNCLVGDV